MLIVQHWFQYAVTGQLASLERWLEALPEQLRGREGAAGSREGVDAPSTAGERRASIFCGWPRAYPMRGGSRR